MQRLLVFLSEPTIPGLATPLAFDAWSIEPALARILYNTVLGLGPRTIVELGSGVSTVVLAHAVRMRGVGGRVVAYEAELEYLEATRRALARESLQEFAEVVHAPLGDVEIDGAIHRWYRIPEPRPFTRVDLLFVDGPPGTTQRRARYPALARFVRELHAKSIVILDDAKRPDEQEILRRWCEDTPGIEVARVATQRGVAVITSLRPSAGVEMPRGLEHAAAPSISTVVVPTRHRPAELRRALSSYARAIDRLGMRIVVVDDCDASRVHEVAEVVREVADAHGVRIEHTTPQSRARFLERMLAAGAPERETRFCLGMDRPRDGTMVGAMRNYGLLATVGEAIVASDDDVVASLDDGGEPGLSVTAAPDPTEIQPIANEEAPTSTNDIASILGAGLVGDIAALAGPIEIDGSMLATIAGPQARPVLVVAPGLRGDPGMGVPAHLLLVRGRSQRHLFDLDDERYRDYAMQPRVRRAVRRATLTRQPFGFAACVALDNRHTLAPFMPSGRNQDGVFFALVRRIAPRSFTLLLPRAIAHPGASRERPIEIAETATEARINDFVMHVVLRCSVSDDLVLPDARCVALGEALQAIAAGDLRAEIHRWWTESRLAFVRRADEARRSRRPAPAGWLEHAKRIEAVVRDAIPRADALDVDEARLALAALGGLLRQWPRIRSVASRLP